MQIAGTNPFSDESTEEPVEEVTEQESEEQPKEAPEEPAEEPQEEIVDEPEEGLFDEEPDGEEEESLFDDPDEEEPKEAAAVPYKRFSRVIRERNELKAEADRYKREKQEIAPLAEAIRKHYGKFKDPVVALEADVRWLEGLEAIKDLPDVQRVLQMARKKMNGEPMTEQVKAEANGSNDAVDKLLRRDARKTAEATLEKQGVKSWLRRDIVDSLLSSHGIDLSEIDERMVLRHAKSYIADRKIPAEDALERRAEKATKPKPVTGGSAKAAVVERKAKSDESADRERPRNQTEWARSHESRLRSLLTELS